MEKRKFNRQSLDYILTDLLPYEKGNHYTHRFFYNYLFGKKKELNSITKDLMKKQKLFNAKWHSAPQEFLVQKKKVGYRKLSYLNPLSCIESIIFIDVYSDTILNIIQNKNGFSLRVPYKTSSLVYKTRNNKTVYYENSDEKEQLLITLESSGHFFTHSPYKLITKFMDDTKFSFTRDRYSNLLLLDVQECFDSIYTHSYKWAITNKTYDSKGIGNGSSVYSTIDNFLQNINGAKTNGIIVGPEMCRLLVEFLLVHVDVGIKDILHKEGIDKSEYEVFRYIDDYFVFSNDLSVEKKIEIAISEALSNFSLLINKNKVERYEKYQELNSWKYEYNIKNIIIESLVIKNEEELKPLRYKTLREQLNLLLATEKDVYKITSYILSTVVSKIEDYNREQSSGKKLNMNVSELVEFIFYCYTVAPCYTTMQKIIRIGVLLYDYKAHEVQKSFGNSIMTFSKEVFTNYISDWVDLLLFISCYKINLSYNLIDSISEKIFEKGSPQNIAALYIYLDKMQIENRKYRKRLNDIIEEKLNKINWEKFFEDKLSWWIFIFYSYPYLSKVNKLTIENNLQTQKDKNSKFPEKIIVLEFLIDKTSHFVDWEFAEVNYYKKYFFYTKDRTVFNPYILNQNANSI